MYALYVFLHFTVFTVDISENHLTSFLVNSVTVSVCTLHAGTTGQSHDSSTHPIVSR